MFEEGHENREDCCLQSRPSYRSHHCSDIFVHDLRTGPGGRILPGLYLFPRWHPTRQALEEYLYHLEGGAAAAAFSSGMAAIAAIFQAWSTGDLLSVSNDCYRCTARLLQ
jgi:hypothetical protein